MPKLERKQQERFLHDKLRGSHRNEPDLNSNKKFYAIAADSGEYMREWTRARCAGKRILDYCCGNGEHALWAAENGAEAYGIDISPVSVENAKAEAVRRGVSGKATFLVMDAEATEFPGGFFDYIVTDGCLHHLDLPRAYAELARILKGNGQVIAREALRHNILIGLYRKRTPALRTAWEAEHILGKSEIYSAGQWFKSVRVERFCYLARLLAVPFRNSRVFGGVHRGLRAIDHVLLALPWLKWQAWMAVFVLGDPKPCDADIREETAAGGSGG